MLILESLEYVGTYWLFAMTAGVPGNFSDRLGLQTFRPQLIFGEGGWLGPTLAGIGLLLAIPTTFYIVVIFTDFDTSTRTAGLGQVLEKALSTGDAYSLSVNVLVVCIVGPFLEEAVFRGFLQNSLLQLSKSSRGAIVTSSLIFSAAHVSSRAFVPLFLLGLVLGTTYQKSSNLCTPFLVHVTYNCIISVLVVTLEVRTRT